MAEPRAILLCAFLAAATLAGVPTAEACSTARLDRLLAAPLPVKAAREFGVGTRVSGEGGHWQVFGDPARQIARTDYGETGRTSLRLVVEKAGTYGLVRTQTHYTKSIGVPGNRERGTTTTTYRFCDAELVRPGGLSEVAFAAYRATAAREKAEFEAAEIRPFVTRAGL